MKFKTFRQSLVLGFAGLAFSSIATAGITLSVQSSLEDDNLEYVITAAGDIITPNRTDFNILDPSTYSHVLGVGDRLRTVFQIDAVNDETDTQVQDLTGAQELTGIAEIEITAVSGGTIEFGPSASFATEFSLSSGSMVAFYEQNPGNFDVNCHSLLGDPITNCESAATDGNLWMVAGFGDADDYWFSVGAATVMDVVANLDANSIAGGVNYGLSVLENYTGYSFVEHECASVVAIAFINGATACGDDGLTEVVGSGSVLGGDLLADPFFARSDFDFGLVRLPEPTPVALLGLGLVLMSLARRKRK